MSKPVERLFPFVIRSRAYIAGRELLAKSKHDLQWILITTDISENSQDEIASQFSNYPIIKHFTSDDLQEFFNLNGCKVLGFKKGDLAKSIYQEMKSFRINN